MNKAEHASASGHREEATRLLTQAQAAAPNHPLVLNAWGLTALNAGDASAARPFFEKAIALDDKNAAFWLNLATCFRKLGLGEEERNALNQALTIDPHICSPCCSWDHSLPCRARRGKPQPPTGTR